MSNSEKRHKVYRYRSTECTGTKAQSVRVRRHKVYGYKGTECTGTEAQSGFVL